MTGLKALSPVREGLLDLLTDVLVNEFDSSRRFAKVYSNADLASLMGLERQRALLGCEVSECLAEVQGALNVDLLLNGTLSQVGPTYRLSLTLLDARSGGMAAREAISAELDEEALVEATHRLARAVLERYGGAAPSKLGVVSGPRGTRRMIGLGIAGAGAATLVAAVVTDVLAVQRYQDVVRASQANDPVAYDRYRIETKQLGLTANVLYASAAVITAGGATLYFLNRAPAAHPPATVGASVVPLPGGAWVGLQGVLP